MKLTLSPDEVETGDQITAYDKGDGTPPHDVLAAHRGPYVVDDVLTGGHGSAAIRCHRRDGRPTTPLFFTRKGKVTVAR